MDGTIKYRLEVWKPKSNLTETIKQVIWNLYVDDSTNSFDNAQEAIKFYEEWKSCLIEEKFESKFRNI